MKQKLPIILILSAAMLACSAKPQPAVEEPPPVQTSAIATAEPTPEEKPTPEAEPTPEEKPTPEVEPETIVEVRIPIDEQQYTCQDCRYTLLDNDDCLIEVLFSLGTNAEEYVSFCAQNRTDQDITIYVQDMILNETVQVPAYCHLSVPAHGTAAGYSVAELVLACEMIGYDSLRELNARIRILDPDYTCIGELTATASMPDGVRLHIAYGPFFGMRADRQILRADDRITIALLYGGCLLENLHRGEYSRLSGTLWIRNNAAGTIPVTVSGVRINEMVVPVYASDQRIASGESFLLDFSVDAKDLLNMEIRSVYSMQIQILTSEEENSGVNQFLGGMEGGVWYPVQLTEFGAPDETQIEAASLFDNGEISIGLIRIETEKGFYEGQTRVRAVFLIENRRNEGVSLSVDDLLVGDRPYEDAYWGKTSRAYLSNSKIGPESRSIGEITLNLMDADVQDGIPELSFVLQVLSQGKDVIFYTVPERIVLPNGTSETSREE